MSGEGPAASRAWFAKHGTPAARLLSTVWIVAGIAALPLDRPASLLAGAVSVFCVFVLTRPSARRFLRTALPAATVIAAVVLPFWLGDSPRHAALVTARALMAAAAALALAAAQSTTELPAALRSLHVPAVIASVLSTAIRQFQAVRDQARRLALARTLRGARRRWASTEALSALLLSTARRADRVDLAMRLRGHHPTTATARARLRRADWVVLLPALALGALPHVAAVAVGSGGP